MRRLNSWGSQKAKADATQAAADQDYTRPWPTTESRPAHTSNTQQDPSDAGQTTGSHLSDDELRAMEQSALEYAIMQSQQQTDRCCPILGLLSMSVKHYIFRQHMHNCISAHACYSLHNILCCCHLLFYMPVVMRKWLNNQSLVCAQPNTGGVNSADSVISP